MILSVSAKIPSLLNSSNTKLGFPCASNTCEYVNLGAATRHRQSVAYSLCGTRSSTLTMKGDRRGRYHGQLGRQRAWRQMSRQVDGKRNPRLLSGAKESVGQSLLRNHHGHLATHPTVPHAQVNDEEVFNWGLNAVVHPLCEFFRCDRLDVCVRQQFSLNRHCIPGIGVNWMLLPEAPACDCFRERTMSRAVDSPGLV